MFRARRMELLKYGSDFNPPRPVVASLQDLLALVSHVHCSVSSLINNRTRLDVKPGAGWRKPVGDCTSLVSKHANHTVYGVASFPELFRLATLKFWYIPSGRGEQGSRWQGVRSSVPSALFETIPGVVVKSREDIVDLTIAAAFSGTTWKNDCSVLLNGICEVLCMFSPEQGPL